MVTPALSAHEPLLVNVLGHSVGTKCRETAKALLQLLRGSRDQQFTWRDEVSNLAGVIRDPSAW